MLPDLARLSLEPTGLFYALPQPEADALNASGGVDPITLDQYQAGQHRDSDEATFSVRNAEPNGSGAYGYRVYIAEGLWKWVSRNLNGAKLPDTRQPIWREDWWELSDRYAPGVPYPHWVRDLPLSDPGVPDSKTYAPVPVRERRRISPEGAENARQRASNWRRAPPARLPRPPQRQYPTPSAMARLRQLTRQQEQIDERRRRRLVRAGRLSMEIQEALRSGMDQAELERRFPEIARGRELEAQRRAASEEQRQQRAAYERRQQQEGPVVYLGVFAQQSQ